MFYFWIAAGVAVFLSAFSSDISGDSGRIIGLLLIGLLSSGSGLWFLVGTYQIMFRDVRKLFIVSELLINDGSVQVVGLYFKHDVFNISDLVSIRRFRIESHWLKRINSLFARDTDHFLIDLADGRQFCFQGESKNIEDVLLQFGLPISGSLPINWDIEQSVPDHDYDHKQNQ